MTYAYLLHSASFTAIRNLSASSVYFVVFKLLFQAIENKKIEAHDNGSQDSGYF